MVLFSNCRGSTTLQARYIRGMGLIARMDETNAKAYYLLNGHGDVVELRDSNGQILNQYRYDLWGKPVVLAEAVANPFLYSAEYWDAATDLQYLRARWYDPGIGRFISEDTYKGDPRNPLSLNLYTYVENNPLKYVDPTGHWPEWVKDAWDYVSRSGKQVIQGNYTDEVTLLGTGFQIGLGFTGLDIIGDIRDVWYDVTQWEWSWQHAGQTGLDAIAFFPIVGLVKYFDEVAVLIKRGGNVVQRTGKGFNDIAKSSSPQDSIKSLESSGWTKTIEAGGGRSGPATILKDPSTGLKVRVHTNPSNNIPYFRVQNSGGNYLGSDGLFPSNATKQEIGDLTHFYFGN